MEVQYCPRLGRATGSHYTRLGHGRPSIHRSIQLGCRASTHLEAADPKKWFALGPDQRVNVLAAIQSSQGNKGGALRILDDALSERASLPPKRRFEIDCPAAAVDFAHLTLQETLPVGERLRTRIGSTVVEAVRPKPGVHRVCSVAVEHEHQYFVSKLGVPGPQRNGKGDKFHQNRPQLA